MNNPYDLHRWSKHYREEALQEAQRQHLIERARAAERGRAGRGEQRPSGGRVGVVASLGEARGVVGARTGSGIVSSEEVGRYEPP